MPTEKYGKGLKELRCVFVEKACDGAKRGTVVLHNCKVHEASEPVVRCAAGLTDEFKVQVGLYQGSAPSAFLFAMDTHIVC